MPFAPLPVIVAFTSVAILFSVETPEPASPKAFVPPTPTATEIETTSDVMSISVIADAPTWPPAVMLEFSK